MWPDCPDDVVLGELSVVVSTGWELPSRPDRWAKLRFLSLLVPASDAQRPAQGAQRLLSLLDKSLRSADEELLSEDDATGCRILLGTHPTYRSVPSPTERRAAAGEFLVAGWQTQPPSDPAGTFQRRYQDRALRQIMDVLRADFGGDIEDPYDVASIRRWCRVNARRQIYEHGDTTVYRVRTDGLDVIALVEAEPDPDDLLGTELVVDPINGVAPPRVVVEANPAIPGFREIDVTLPRAYNAAEYLDLTFTEHVDYGPDSADWMRQWMHVNALNDHYDLEVSVTFDDDVELPDLCWWFAAEPIVDLNEAGPKTVGHLANLANSRAVTRRWRTVDTERRRLYGFVWCWLDDESWPVWNDIRQLLAEGR